jgi:hypothetical protein
MAIYVDASSVKDEQEALSLMFHHLELAAAYFEAASAAVQVTDVPDVFSHAAICPWMQEMDSLYTRDEQCRTRN